MKTFSHHHREWGADHRESNQVQNMNFTLEIQNRKVEGFITYSIDQQIFMFKTIIGHKKTRNHQSW